MELGALDLAIARAWPAREELAVGPWTARIDAGVTRRPNSVLPHGEGTPPAAGVIDDWLRTVVQLYRGRGLTPWLQVTRAAWPAGLDGLLGARGWQTGIDRTLLLTGPLPEAGGAPGLPGIDVQIEVQLDPRPQGSWLETWWSVDPRGGAPQRDAAAAILDRIGDPAAFARVVAGGACVGVALGVLVDGLLVLECIATRPELRRSGVARAAIGELGRWAAERGTTGTLLAVQEANGPARALYEALGLGETSSYAYARPPEHD